MAPDRPAPRRVRSDLRRDAGTLLAVRLGREGRDVDRALKSESLTCAVAALRARQAHLLPRSPQPRTPRGSPKVMGFALAAAVLAERFDLVGRARNGAGVVSVGRRRARLGLDHGPNPHGGIVGGVQDLLDMP